MCVACDIVVVAHVFDEPKSELLLSNKQSMLAHRTIVG